jgi:hypothetical protein
MSLRQKGQKPRRYFSMRTRCSMSTGCSSSSSAWRCLPGGDLVLFRALLLPTVARAGLILGLRLGDAPVPPDEGACDGLAAALLLSTLPRGKARFVRRGCCSCCPVYSVSGCVACNCSVGKGGRGRRGGCARMGCVCCLSWPTSLPCTKSVAWWCRVCPSSSSSSSAAVESSWQVGLVRSGASFSNHSCGFLSSSSSTRPR